MSDAKVTREKMRNIARLTDDLGDCFPAFDFYGIKGKIAAYFLLQIPDSDSWHIEYSKIESNEFNIREDVYDFMMIYLSGGIWENLQHLREDYSPEELIDYIFYPVKTDGKSMDVSTPDSIINLAQGILDIQKDDYVADICCGEGDFLKKSVEKYPQTRFAGFDINEECVLLSKIKAELLDGNIDICQTNAFNLDDRKFHKIFSQYPLGLRLKTLGLDSAYLKHLEKVFPAVSSSMSGDWIYNMLLMDHLEAGGKAVSIMSSGATWNTIDAPIRKYFIEHGYIESMISLPEKMFVNFNVPVTLIVLSRGNKDVRLVNASDICLSGRRYNTFRESDIQEILKALHEDSDISMLVSAEEIRQKDYILGFSSYQDFGKLFDDSVLFDSLMKNITRGTSYTAKQLDAMSSPEKTNTQYLMLSDIQDGMICYDQLHYLEGIESRLERYCLKDKNLIISKMGCPFKIAVVEISDDRQILATGNLFIIELDEQKVNPYYLKAFFESNVGSDLLMSMAKGTRIMNLGVSDLKSIPVPLPSLEEQQEIVNQYLEIQNRVKSLKEELAANIEKLGHVFDEFLAEN